jgi:DNA-directed RNA polymerase subunit M/transcription elongation factor TFIIS
MFRRDLELITYFKSERCQETIFVRASPRATCWHKIRSLALRRRDKLALKSRWYNDCSRYGMMRKAVASETGRTSNDIFFDCPHCSAPLVVNAAAAGITLSCQRCGEPVKVPTESLPSGAATANNQNLLAELERRLKENASQRTEVVGYINQLSIQLHRWQHRLNVLNERQTELEAEIAAAANAAS